ncbi:hypothetical protein EX895_003495 [Sporisorium graminicola]|uniref:WD40 repeat-like protein n=1 Tax=Sporisorium graminicola TaxID=280036 RepID=A0A4U7KSP1_9BASI|nr:hypothetical protein EX895_003495 [Sporisorium graminicola]TKY87481.1 hypothetical protein EX895_003495 [Sporisorium graminicola]
MAEPPFQMPGHRWDPDKKRFFKILPGQTSLGTTSHTASSSTSSGGRSAKGKQKDEKSAENHFASTPRLPAIDLRSAAQKVSGKHKSAFKETTLDPVTLRQQGASSVNAKGFGDRSRIEAAYSHLALFTARRPLSSRATPDTIIGIQSDLDGYALAVLHDVSVVRIVPDHGVCQKLFEARGPDELLFIWTGSARLLCGAFLSRYSFQTFLSLSKPVRPEVTDSDDEDFEEFDIPYWHAPETADFMEVDAPVFAPGQGYWAFAETVPAPHRSEEVQTDFRPVPSERLESTLAFALVAGEKVSAREYEFEKGISRGFRATRADFRFESDVMSVAFDPSGEALYCGLRSGRVFIWREFADILREDATKPVEMPIETEGSITNIAIVSSTEMLLVRVNGQVQLVDISTGQVKRRFQGHVNSYSYTLAFAADKDLRLFALTGTDRRVRIWSLESPQPLGTSATTLPVFVHRHDHDQQDQQPHRQALYDESGSKSFTQTHAASDNKPGMQRGSTLSSIVFPSEVRALHWHPRYPYEGRDPHEVEAFRQEQSVDYRPPQQRWKDLYVAAGEWLYQFRFP